MKIKSLLLGSAAALVAVSGARAADAVVIPEPEAVEYVRVCDAAGAGYFYIPGGETCLKISGYVQYEMTFLNNNAGTATELTVGEDTLVFQSNDNFNKAYEARLQFDAWRDTSYGPLATQIRLTAGGNALAGSSTSSLNVDRAYFDLAGLRMGVDASAWDYGFGGPADAYNVGGSNGGTVRYTANFGAGSFTLSLEEDSFQDDYMPSIVGVASFSAGDLSFTLGAVYEDDSSAIGQLVEDVIGPITGVGTAWGVKGTASYSAGAFGIGAGFQYSSAYAHNTVGVSDYMAAYEWVLGADVSYDAGALDLGLGFQYGINGYDDVAAIVADSRDNDWIIGASASYDITETLNTNLRLRYDSDENFSARLRFKSSF